MFLTFAIINDDAFDFIHLTLHSAALISEGEITRSRFAELEYQYD